MTDDLVTRLHGNLDARLWAQEFAKVYGEPRGFTEYSIKDLSGSVEGWFANAIEVAKIHGAKRRIEAEAENYDIRREEIALTILLKLIGVGALREAMMPEVIKLAWMTADGFLKTGKETMPSATEPAA